MTLVAATIDTALTFAYSSNINHHTSPLLRLPGELRNRIYEYMLSDLIIHSFQLSPKLLVGFRVLGGHESSPAREAGSRMLPSARDNKSQDIMPLISQYLSFFQVCGHVKAEAHLVPFILNTIQVQSDNLGDFLCLLTNAQRAAITSFRIGNSMSEDSPWCPSRWVIQSHFSKRNKPGDAFCYWSGLRDLSRLSGLKRAVIGNQYFVELEQYEEMDKEKVIANQGIRWISECRDRI